MIDPQTQLQDLRNRVLNQEPISPEEYAAVIRALRANRRAAEPKAGKKPKVVPATMAELDALMDDPVDETPCG